MLSASSSEQEGGVGVEGQCVREGEPTWLASPLCSVLSAAMSEQEVQCIIIKFLAMKGLNPQKF